MIEGTVIEDTKENREVYDLVRALGEAMVEQDADALLSHVSKSYFEDMGTVDDADDFGYAELIERVLPETLKATRELHLAVEVQDIVVTGDKAHADVQYSSRARVDMPAGSSWESHRDFNRIELAREDGVWRVTSGL